LAARHAADVPRLGSGVLAQCAGHFAGVVQAVADEPGTEIILESTANGVGGEFHARWQNAEAGSAIIRRSLSRGLGRGYTRDATDFASRRRRAGICARLHGLTNEQLAWRRNKIAELGDETLFKQEYPSTAAEAFQMTGHDGFIKPEDVVRARKATSRASARWSSASIPSAKGTTASRSPGARAARWRRSRATPSRSRRWQAASKLKDIIDRDNPGGVHRRRRQRRRHPRRAGQLGREVSQDRPLVNFGSAPFHPPPRDKDGKEMAGYLNRRAEMWGLSRDWLQAGRRGRHSRPRQPADRRLRARISLSPGQPEARARKQGAHANVRKVRSPDEWDAVALTFAEPVPFPLPCLTINTLPQFIGQVVGDRRANQTSIKVLPREERRHEDRRDSLRADPLDRNPVQGRPRLRHDVRGNGDVRHRNFRVDMDYAYEDAFERDLFIRAIPNPLAVGGIHIRAIQRAGTRITASSGKRVEG
jgi:hypothetical protein